MNVDFKRVRKVMHEKHLGEIKHIQWYQWTNVNMKLTFCVGHTITLEGYINFDYVEDLDSRKSMSG